MNISLRGQVVIAFRSNSYCFWEIWAVRGSIPLSGTWFFFFVQINYFKVFLHACISYNDIKKSKALCNLSRITINFWTLCILSLAKGKWGKNDCTSWQCSAWKEKRNGNANETVSLKNVSNMLQVSKLSWFVCLLKETACKLPHKTNKSTITATMQVSM